MNSDLAAMLNDEQRARVVAELVEELMRPVRDFHWWRTEPVPQNVIVLDERRRVS